MGQPLPISHREILAYAVLMHLPMRPRDVEVISLLDREWRAINAATKAAPPADDDEDA